MKSPLRHFYSRLVYSLRMARYGWLALADRLKPAYIIQYVTDQCHLKCDGCFVDLQGKNRITLAVQKRIIRQTPNVPLVVLTGGEPFSHPALERLCRLWAVYARVLQVHVPTSGFYPDRIAGMIRRWQGSFSRGLISTRLHITLSLDGPAGLHNAIRGNGESFRRLRRSIRLLDGHAGRGVDYSISVTLGRANLEHTDEIERTLDKLSLKKCESVNYILTRSKPGHFPAGGSSYSRLNIHRPAEELAGLYTPGELKTLVGIYDRLTRQNRPRINGLVRPWAWLKTYKNRSVYTRVLKQLRAAAGSGRSTGYRPCPAGNKLWVITTDGTLMPCEMMNYSAGNLLHNSQESRSEAEQFNRTIHTQKCECSHECYLGVSALV